MLPVVVLVVLRVLTLRLAVLHLPVAVAVQLRESTLVTAALVAVEIALLMAQEILPALHRLKATMAGHLHHQMQALEVVVHLRLEQILQVAQ